MTSKDSADQADNRIYEVGFHIVPSIPEEKLSSEMTAIKDVLEKNGAVFISEEFPKLKPLSYQMTKVLGPKHLKFDTAYFGWVKFEMAPENIDIVKKALELSETILRFLIIKTVRESTLSVIKPAYRPTEAKPIPGIDTKQDAPVKSPVSEAELDKTIDALVVE
ncbi:MAG: hypothetical protein UX39_C0005G0021 [Candidatus Magasanikbacteria bacterium GW2011_GWA2_46_17]|uniref:Small ribosomal subunit protein bS6 n=1 Tax=Candidatus Magasanikbacteria bacterium GW2011_GWA2_46_17 TaxID=1619042 RepID=A0A0G1RAC1_9BACT|nr:MAG: hypothetical protein UX39_C0005G0021 [Candidatus Magasanikbacteria bacterium GW2011_GWA2_46_17]